LEGRAWLRGVEVREEDFIFQGMEFG